MALHRAGYRELSGRIDSDLIVDLGCGLGFDSVTLTHLPNNVPSNRPADRVVVGVDYDPGAAIEAYNNHASQGFIASAMDASRLAFRTGSLPVVCSSHLIEHFLNPQDHVSEIARVLADDGSAYFLAPNAMADFENPYHVTSFSKLQLAGLLGQFFDQVWVGGLDGSKSVKEDLSKRRIKGNNLLALDFFKLRHKIPRSWYIFSYTKILPLTYRIFAKGDSNGNSGITSDDFHVTQQVDDTTLVLFAIAAGPRRIG